jgi:predicted O-methyltransferase YrrM
MRPIAVRESPFGRLSVFHDTVHDAHVLVNDTTWHGWQFRAPSRLDEPTGYYAPGSPIAELMAALRPGARVAVVGLGAGVMASLAAQGQSMTFYEIDPDVISLARDPSLFSFLLRCEAEVSVREGDALQRVTEAPPGTYDLIAVDAFSGDAVPPAMLSPEAVARFVSRLAPHGVAAFHLTSTSQGKDHRPALARAARGLAAAVRDHHSAPLPRDRSLEIDEDFDLSAPVESRWAVVAPRAASLARLTASAQWQPLTTA